MNTDETRPSATFPFESRFVSIAGYRIHYVEEGDGPPVLFIHGTPTSSYVWRNILPKTARDTGRKGIALDLLGFGKSDKPEDVKHTLRLHREFLEAFIEKLGLKDLVLVLHDWGGPIGTSYAVDHPENVQGLVLMETFLWNTTWQDFGKYKPGFKLFRSPFGYIVLQLMNLFINVLLPRLVARRKNMTKEIMRHYREPFPSVASRKAVRVFPQLVPIDGKPEESYEFIEQIEQKLYGTRFPILWIKATPGMLVSGNTEYRLTALKARLKRLEVREFGPGLHFLQEDDPDKISGLIVDWMRANKLTRKREGAPLHLRDVA
jgi:haloalkane dehalogenase